ncbi:MAG: sigma-70 family RNA polymerase sigma factor [Pseudomonadota bacterium]
MDELATTSRDSDDLIDKALLRRIADEQDSAALQTLYRRYAPRVTGFLRRMTQDSGLIEEAYNDVMLTVWKKASQYRAESKASSWVFSIAYRVCLRMVKKQKFRAGVLDMLQKERQSEGFEVDRTVERSDLIQAALEKLSIPHRLVIELSYFRDFSTEEIAEIVGCPRNTVKTRLFHARKQVRSFVEQQGGSTA